MTERWLPVPGFEGRYEVSDFGCVKSLPHTRRGPHGATRRFGVRILKPQPYDADGRVQVKLGGRDRKIHHLVLTAFVGPCPAGMECRHLDGDPTNNRLDNLAWGTHAENEADKIRHGTKPRGEGHPQAKLTAASVLDIRKRLRLGASQRAVALAYGVAQSTVGKIAAGRTWLAT